MIYDFPKKLLHFFNPTQAGLTNLEVKFKEWEWEQGLHVFTLEDVGLGKTFVE